MKQSCITHPENDNFLVLFQWQVDICQGNHSEAACIACFVSARYGTLALPQYVNAHILVHAMRNLYAHKTVLNACFSLEQRGILSSYRLNQEQARQLCIAKSPQRCDPSAPLICHWCNGETWALQEHHFPKTKAEGGLETVMLCANCHVEYHWLIGSYFFIPTMRLDAYLLQYPLDDAEQNQCMRAR